MLANIESLLKVTDRLKSMLSKNELKFIKSLKIKKYRVREKRFLVEGTKNVHELLQSDFNIDLLVGSSEFFARTDRLNRDDIRTETTDKKTLSAISNYVTNTECVAIAEIPHRELVEIDFDQQLFLLDGISDPGNLGTILRTLDWFGFDQVVCSTSSADLYNPKVISSTMGAFTRVKVWYEELPKIIAQSKLTIYGAEMEGENLFNTKMKVPSIIVMGSESQGISAPVKALLHQAITIPRYGQSESLNVGVATGIIAGYLRNS